MDGFSSMVHIWRKFLSAKNCSDPRLPSLVRTLQKIAPHSVVREVVGASNDRRQWGVLTAAWLGVSERELMRAAAKDMGCEFVERVPRIDLGDLVGDRRALLNQLRDIGIVPIFEGAVFVRCIVVDPAEVRSFTLYSGRETVTLGCWSDISRCIDEAFKELQVEEDARIQQFQVQQAELCAKVIEILIQEASGHGAHSLELVTVDGSPRYQFEAKDGRRGRGNVHKGIISTLYRYLARIDGHSIKSKRVGDVLVRSIGSLTDFRLTWSVGKSSQLQAPALQALPAPPLEHCGVRQQAGEAAAAFHNRSDPDRVEFDPTSSEKRGDPILIVDDNPMFARVVERMLSRDGYLPSFAENGVAAIEKLSAMQSLLPSAIVCDLHMPKMNGKEFVAHIRADERWGSIPIIMLTSDDDVEAEVSLLNLGVDAFVSKSKDPRVLVAQVRRVTRDRIHRIAA